MLVQFSILHALEKEVKGIQPLNWDLNTISMLSVIYQEGLRTRHLHKISSTTLLPLKFFQCLWIKSCQNPAFKSLKNLKKKSIKNIEETVKVEEEIARVLIVKVHEGKDLIVVEEVLLVVWRDRGKRVLAKIKKVLRLIICRWDEAAFVRGSHICKWV